jgi:hypothetical protein
MKYPGEGYISRFDSEQFLNFLDCDVMKTKFKLAHDAIFVAVEFSRIATRRILSL